MDKAEHLICVVAHDLASFEVRRRQILGLGFPGDCILHLDSNLESRWSFAEKRPGFWMFFTDADCEVTAPTLNRIKTIISIGEKKVVHVGHYLDPVGAGYLQKAHNRMANLWAQTNVDSAGSGMILGGVVLIFSAPAELENQKRQMIHFWGAEDKYWSQRLRLKGYAIRHDPDLQVIHHTSGRFKHFVRRAWLHGVNDVLFLNEKFKFQSPLIFREGLRRIEKSDWVLAPAVALHLLIQKMAKLIQSIHQVNSKIK